MARKRSSGPGSTPKRIMGLIKKRLRSEAGKELAGFVRRVSGRAGAEAQLNLDDDPEVGRFLTRLGWLESRKTGRARPRRVGEIVDELARAAGLDPLAIGLYLRLFASGEAALSTEPVCGEMPRCLGCELGDVCRYRQRELSQPAPARTERPAERLRREGEDALTGTELTALVLSGKGLAEAEALAAARRLLGEAGSLRDLAARPLKELAAVEGMSEELALRLRAALALARRWNVEVREQGRQFKTGRDFFEFFAPRLRHLKKETFFVVLLDQKNRYMAAEPVSTGTLTGSLVHPREVFRPAIREAAAAVAFVHNHPSGNPKPSKDDLEITARLLEVGKLVGLRVLDHVIVGEEGYFSFVEEGLI